MPGFAFTIVLPPAISFARKPLAVGRSLSSIYGRRETAVESVELLLALVPAHEDGAPFRSADTMTLQGQRRYRSLRESADEPLALHLRRH